MKLKLFVIPLLIPSFLNATVADHGFAVIERLRNSTTYPVQVSTKKTVHDRLPIESVVRIKSRKPEYGEDGRYYALRQDGGRYILRSDAIDSSDPATEFIVYRHLDKDLNDWLGFSSFAANRQMMRATKTQSVQFFGKDFENEESIGAHWKISGSNLIGCHLQSRLTKGFLSARSLDDARLDIAKYVRPEMPKIKFLDSKSFSKDKPRYKSYVKELKKDVFLSLGDLSVLARNPYEPWFTFKKFKPGFFKMGFSDAKATVKIRKKSNPFSVHEMLALINHTRRYILEKPTQVVSTVEGFGKEAEEARKRSFQENHQLLYGDKIRFVHHFTWQNLYANRDRFNHEGSSENMMTFCSNDDVNSEDSEFADSWWIVKGPHSDDDRFNCAIGTPVGNSATIRLEHVITGKNLRCQKTAPPSVIVGGIERQKHRYEVSIAGKDGIGTSYDNWTISFHDKAKQFNSGQLFLLNHVATGSSLFSDNEFFTSSGSSTNIVDDNSMWIVELTLGVTGEGRPVRFRDRVRFKNMTTGRYLHLQQHDSNVAATEDIQKEDTAIMWRIKGAHKKGDRWNCRNEQVESGAIIRLESSSNGKNLFIDPTFENPGLKTQQTMGPGIGNENDDWELKIIGKNQTLVDGSRVVLRHVQSRQKKVVREIAVNTSDELIAKEYIEKIAAKKPEKQSILQRVAALQLETEETKQMREEIRKLDDEDQKKQAALQKKAKARADKLTGEAKVKALEAIQEIKKPKSPRKKELEAKLTQHDHKLLWFVSDSSTSQVSAKDTAWTGVPYGSPAEQGPDELIDIEVVRLGRGAGVLPGRTVDIKVDLLTKPPTFSGFAIEKVLNFDSSFLLNLNPLLNKGAAWLERSLDTPGRASVAFMAQAKDKGDIQVLFGNELVLDYTWKIIIGANNNTETQIIRRSLKDGEPKDKVVASVRKETNPLAAASPGRFVPYWVSVYDGEILLGGGNIIGESVILAWKDVEPRSKVSRIGFGSYKSAVKYAGVQVGSPVTLQKPKRIYVKIPSASLSASQEPVWQQKGLRIPGRGSVSFSVKGRSEVLVVLGNAGGRASGRYAVRFTSQNHEQKGRVSLLKLDGQKDEYTTLASTPFGISTWALQEQEWKSFWISVMGGRFFIGNGAIGENLFLYHWDPAAFDEFRQIGLQSVAGEAQLKDIVIAPAVTVALQQEQEEYETGAAAAMKTYRGDLHVIAPFEYHFSQEGQVVKFEDKINKKTFYPGKTPQQDAWYYFMLTIAKDGFPKLVWSRQPENPQKIEKQKSAYLTRAGGEAFYQASTYTQGAGEVASVVGATLSIAHAEVGLALMKKAITDEAKVKYGYRDHTAYTYLDATNYTKMSDVGIPREAKNNRIKVEGLLELGSKWKPSSQKKLERLIPHYLQTVLLVNHPYVVRNPVVKNSIISNIETLYAAHKELHAPPKDKYDPTYKQMMNLLMHAYNNTSLTSPYEAKDQQKRLTWLGWLNELSREILQKNPRGTLMLRPSFGEYVWLSEKFALPDSGSVSFEAKGANDIMVGLAARPQQMRNTSNDIYEVSIGSNNNSMTSIRAYSLDRSVAQTTKPKARANSLVMQKYWISVNNGKIVFGKGEMLEENKLLEWQDPYPVTGVRNIGLSCWDVPVEFRNITTGQALSFK